MRHAGKKHTPAMLYKSVRTIMSGVRVPNKAWPAHLLTNFRTQLVRQQSESPEHRSNTSGLNQTGDKPNRFVYSYCQRLINLHKR